MMTYISIIAISTALLILFLILPKNLFGLNFKKKSDAPLFDIQSCWKSNLVANINNNHFIYNCEFRDGAGVIYEDVVCHYNYDKGLLMVFLNKKQLQPSLTTYNFIRSFLAMDVEYNFGVGDTTNPLHALNQIIQETSVA